MATGSFLCEPVAAMCVVDKNGIHSEFFEKEKKE